MPLVIIHSLPPKDQGAVAKMIGNVRNSGANALNCPISNIWVIFNPMSSEHYAPSDGTGPGLKENLHPPLVFVKANAGRTHEQRAAFMAAIADAVGAGLSMSSEKIWIHYEEMEPQNIWFGSKWSV